MIGDTEQCCRDHYIGHVRNDAYMDMLARLIEEGAEDPFA